MAQHQLPLNSLGDGNAIVEGGGGGKESGGGEGTAADNCFMEEPPDGVCGELPTNNHGNGNSFRNHLHHQAAYLPPPTYSGGHPNQGTYCFVGSNAADSASCSSSTAAAVSHSPLHPPLSGSLPPITSMDTQRRGPLQQYFDSAGAATFAEQQQQQPNTSSSISTSMYNNNRQQRPTHQQQHQKFENSNACSNVWTPTCATASTSGSSMQQQQQHRFFQNNNNNNEFTPTMGTAGGHQTQFRPQQVPSVNSMMASSPMMNESHQYHHHNQMMPSPAFSAHGMNNNSSAISSNPGSIISAPPESPLSSQSSLVNNNIGGGANPNRSPSVRSNYSLQRMLVNSASTTPDQQQHFMGETIAESNTNQALAINTDVHQSETMASSQNSIGSDGMMQIHLVNNSGTMTTTAPVGKSKRTYAAKSGNNRRSAASVLPLLQQQQQQPSFNPSFSPFGMDKVLPSDGPTVRQHLQQQQAEQRKRQQHEAMVRRLCQSQQQRDEEPFGWAGVQTENPQAPSRKRPQIESAPPSVTINIGHGGPSPCSFPASGPSSSASCSGEQMPLMMTKGAAAPPALSSYLPSKAESLSPPKRGTRSKGGGAKARSIAAGCSTGASADTLASTIASVASGGGSFEFEKPIGTSPTPNALIPGASTEETPSTQLQPPPSHALPQVISPSGKRKKGQQAQQSVASAVMQQTIPKKTTMSSPTSQYDMNSTIHHQQQPVKIVASHQQQQHFDAERESMPAPSQCRIHVQNPPQTHGDFPLTGTKIQVVHMQPGSSHHPQMMAPSPKTPSNPQSAMASHLPLSRLPTARSIGSDTDHSSTFDYPHGATSQIQNLAAEMTAGIDPPVTLSLTSVATPFSPYHSHHPQHLPQQQIAQLTSTQQPVQSIPFGIAPTQSPIYTEMQPPPTPFQFNQQQQQQNQNSARCQGQLTMHSCSPIPPVAAAPNRFSVAPPAPAGAAPQQQQLATPPTPIDGVYANVQQHPQLPLAAPPSLSQSQRFHQQQRQQQQQMKQQQLYAPAPPCLPASTSVQHHTPQQQQLMQPPQSPHQVQQLHSGYSPAMYAVPSISPITSIPFRGPPFVSPAPPPPMASPLPQRAQLSRAQLLSRHSKDIEARKYAVKLYHLQRTVKALVYKNGALADELARLSQRIHTVTEERRSLAKRLQHHERNRIRRIQSQYRKAIAAAAAAEAAAKSLKREEEVDGEEVVDGDESGRPISSISDDFPSSSTTILHKQEMTDERGEERIEKRTGELNGQLSSQQQGRLSTDDESALSLMKTVKAEKDCEPYWDFFSTSSTNIHCSSQLNVKRSRLSIDDEEKEKEEFSRVDNGQQQQQSHHQQPQQLQMTLRPRAISNSTSPTEQRRNVAPQHHQNRTTTSAWSGKQQSARSRTNQPNQIRSLDAHERRSRSSEHQKDTSPKILSEGINNLQQRKTNSTQADDQGSTDRPLSRATRQSSAASFSNHVMLSTSSIQSQQIDNAKFGSCSSSSNDFEHSQMHLLMRPSTRRQSATYQQQKQQNQLDSFTENNGSVEGMMLGLPGSTNFRRRPVSTSLSTASVSGKSGSGSQRRS